MERRLMLFAVALLVGCTSATDSDRPKTFPATGIVTLNGKPVDGATVNFVPMEGSGTSVGMTDANGSYSLSTFTSNDGALPGQYKVSIVKYEGDAPPTTGLPAGQLASGDIDNTTYAPPRENAVVAQSSGPTGPKNLIPTKYSHADSSGLRALIGESGPNENNFDLK